MPEQVSHRNETTEILDAPERARDLAVWIEVLNVGATPRRRLLTNGAVVLGAGLGADIVISDPRVSRRHLQLGFAGRKVEAIDLGSRNGTFCNGQRFTRLTIEQDATLQLGNVHVRLVLRGGKNDTDTSDVLEPRGVVGKCDRMLHVFRQVARLSGSTVPVLVTGETGTGKEAVARAIHERSPMGKGPFVVVNCGGLEHLSARATLFGQGTIAGALERSAGGTLLLDSVGELPQELQARLLGVLDDETFTRVGEGHGRKLSIRIIATSKVSLASLVGQGVLRAELSYRFSAVKLELPPLRERGDDLELLAHHFAAEFDIRQLPAKLLAQLYRYDWPGNVRELRNVIRGHAVLGELHSAPQTTQAVGFDGLLRSVLNLDRPYQEQKDELVNKFIASYLTELLRRTHGNQSEAAKIAGLDRAHLNKMLAKLKRRAVGTGSASEPPGKLYSE